MSHQIKWSIDPAHSEITFKVRHLMIAHVRGNFKTFDASIYTTGKDFSTAEIDVWIDAASITTGNEDRDTHLKSADFFNVETHKQLSFTSSTIEKQGPEGYHELWGELTMNGITKNLKLRVEFGGIQKDPYGNEKAGFSITGQLNRSEWGLVWNSTIETGNIVVSDEVQISCEIELINLGLKDLTMEIVRDIEAENKSEIF